MTDVDNAVILERVEAIIKRQDKMYGKMDYYGKCMVATQIEQAVQRNEINALNKTTDDMKKATLRQDGIVGSALFVAMLAKDKIADIF